MRDRATRYAASRSRQERKTPATVLVAHVGRTPKGKIRLHRIGIRLQGKKEEVVVSDLPPEDPRCVFEDDYKVRKATHDIVKKSARFSHFHDASTRVFYDLD